LIKLVLIDIDGTLVRDDKTLPAENEEAIKEALQSGVLVTLVTAVTMVLLRRLLTSYSWMCQWCFKTVPSFIDPTQVRLSERWA